MAGGEALVDVEDLRSDGGPGKTFGDWAGAAGKGAAEGDVGEEGVEGGSEGPGEGGGDEEPGFAFFDGEGEAAGAGCDDRGAAGHGFDGDEAERFVAGGDGDDVGGDVVQGKLVLRLGTDETKVGRETEVGRALGGCSERTGCRCP